MKKSSIANLNIIHLSIATSIIVVAISIGYYLTIFLPSEKITNDSIEKQKVELQLKQYNLDRDKFELEKNATISATVSTSSAAKNNSSLAKIKITNKTTGEVKWIDPRDAYLYGVCRPDTIPACDGKPIPGAYQQIQIDQLNQKVQQLENK